jgi:two-component system response regulator YesN
VDDNASDREGIRDLIDWQSLDIRVLGLAANGVEGVEKALDLRPNLILADIAMPLMDGIQMTTRLKGELPDTKFIFMSCYDEFDFAKNAIDLEVCAYVLKPIDLDELVGAIGKVKTLITAENDRTRIQNELREQIQANLPVLRAEFIRDLVHGRINEVRDIEARMQYLNIPLKEGVLLLLIQIDSDSLEDEKEVEVEQKYLRIYSVKSCVENILMQEVCGYPIILDNSNLCAILFGDWAVQEDALAAILDLCNQCKNSIQEHFHLQVTIGISDLERSLAAVPRMYQAAEYAARSKFYGSRERIFLASEVKSFDKGYNYHFGELKQEIELLFDNGSQEGLWALLERFYPTGAGYSEAAMRSLSYSIINAFQLLLSERNESLDNIFGSALDIWEKPLRLETLSSLKEWLVSTFTTIQGYLHTLHTSRYQRIIQDIKHIIDVQYPNIQNIEQIVTPLYISPSHANFIFKQATGKTIFEYLVNRRIEVARQMLSDPYCRVYEVSEKVGYMSKSYFTSVFKDHTGQTPKQYRDKSLKGCG